MLSATTKSNQPEQLHWLSVSGEQGAGSLERKAKSHENIGVGVAIGIGMTSVIGYWATSGALGALRSLGALSGSGSLSLSGSNTQRSINKYPHKMAVSFPAFRAFPAFPAAIFPPFPRPAVS